MKLKGVERTGIDCFAGIGGFSLAMQNCGIKPVVQIEIDEFCQRVLQKNFPQAKRYRDICAVSDADLRRFKPWIVCGGFPCQDVSIAGKGKGANEGERSGLWREMWRVIRNTRPDWLLVENVPALRTRGVDSVLTALEALDYTALPLVVGACHVGAPHKRQRVWIVAYANRLFRRACSVETRSAVVEAIKELTKPEGLHLLGVLEHANGDAIRKQSRRRCRQEGQETEIDNWSSAGRFPNPRRIAQGEWETARLDYKSSVARRVDGLSETLDILRIKALGNAIVPKVAEAILRAILRTSYVEADAREV